MQVKPRKGAAVFWWNLRSDGRGDPWTRHAGCSVLYGNKWSKLEHFILQTCINYLFILQQKITFQIKVNGFH